METSTVSGNKKYGTMEKRYDTTPKTIEFWFNMEHNLGTMGKKTILL